MSTQQVDLPLSHVSFARYSLEFAARSQAKKHPMLAKMLVSANWRDVFGKTLRDQNCRTAASDCIGCPHIGDCSYAELYESSSNLNRDECTHGLTASTPYIFYVNENDHNDENRVRVDLTLIGAANSRAREALFALIETAAGSQWKLPRSYRLMRAEVTAGDGPSAVINDATQLPIRPLPAKYLPDCPSSLTLRFDSPLVVRHRGRDMTAKAFNFRSFFTSLLRQISSHASRQGRPLNLDKADFKELAEIADTVEILDDSRLRCVEKFRYSARQDRVHPIRGITGEATFSGDNLAPLWPYIWMGQWLHCGKKTSMGCGRYSVLPPTSTG